MVISESSQLLSIDSFSYRWLVNLSQDPSFRFAIDGKEAAETVTTTAGPADCMSLPSSSGFIEMDPKLTPSKRFLKSSPQDNQHHDFDFDLCVAVNSCSSEQPLPDMIIYNGNFIKPTPAASLDSSKAATSSDENDDADGEKLCSRPVIGSKSLPATPARLVSLGSPKRFIKCSSLRRCGSLSRRVLSRYLEFILPICHRIRGGRLGESSSSSSSSSSSMRSPDSRDQTAGMMKLKRGSSSKVACLPGEKDSAGRKWRMSCDSESCIQEAVLHCKRSNVREDNLRKQLMIN